MQHRHEDFDIPQDVTVTELEEIRSRLDDQISARREQEMSLAAQRLKDAAKDMGYHISELMHLLSERTEHPVKYRHPQNPDLTWCGKGRRPLWMNKVLEEGHTLADLAA